MIPPFGTIEGEIVRAAVVGGAFLLLFATAEAWRVLGDPPVEWTRKLVHLGAGLIAATFPWLFARHWTVLLLGAAMFLILWGTRRVGLLRSVHGVARKSEGGLYYPVAVYLLFVIARGYPPFYLVALLALVVSDTAAAVLGSSYGRFRYTVERDRRSIEGSAVFFFSTFLVVHLPLLLLTETSRELTVLVAFQLALLVTLFEAISLRGNDNLIVPLMTYFLLHKLTRRDPAFLAYQTLAQLVIMGFVGLIAWRFRFLTASGAMSFMLFFYGAYSLGGEEWIVAPAIALFAFTAYYLLRGRRPGAPDRRFQVAAAFHVAIVPGLLYVANNVFETLVRVPPFDGVDQFYPLYVGAVAAQLGLAVTQLDRALAPTGQRGDLVDALAPLGAAAIVIPAGLAVSHVPWARSALLAGTIVVVATAVHYLALRLLPPAAMRVRERGPWALRLQAISVAVAAALVVPLVARS